MDKSGVAPLHRAVRTRCAAAVKALLDSGADARAVNRKGSTPMLLATQSTGRGGTGSVAAKAQQAEILRAWSHMTDVSFGSFGSVWPRTDDFRSTPINRHRCRARHHLRGAGIRNPSQKQTFLLAQSDGRIDVISLCDAN